jgi:hypothetical protein
VNLAIALVRQPIAPDAVFHNEGAVLAFVEDEESLAIDTNGREASTNIYFPERAFRV